MVTPAQHRSTALGAATSTLRQYSSMSFRLFYSDNIATYAGGSTPGAVGPADDRARRRPCRTATPSTFAVHVVGNPAAGIQQVWVTYDGQGGASGTWQSLDLTRDATDSTLWTGSLPLSGQPAGDVRFVVQAVNGVGLVSMDDNQGAYYSTASASSGGTQGPILQATSVALTSPASGVYGTSVPVSATLTADGTPLPNRVVTFSIGQQTTAALTDGSGRAAVQLPLLALPTSTTMSASFAGSGTEAAAADSAPFTIGEQPTGLSLTPPSASARVGVDTGIVATLSGLDGGAPLVPRRSCSC